MWSRRDSTQQTSSGKNRIGWWMFSSVVRFYQRPPTAQPLFFPHFVYRLVKLVSSFVHLASFPPPPPCIHADSDGQQRRAAAWLRSRLLFHEAKLNFTSRVWPSSARGLDQKLSFSSRSIALTEKSSRPDKSDVPLKARRQRNGTPPPPLMRLNTALIINTGYAILGEGSRWVIATRSSQVPPSSYSSNFAIFSRDINRVVEFSTHVSIISYRAFVPVRVEVQGQNRER